MTLFPEAPNVTPYLDGPMKVWMTHVYDNKPWQTSGSLRAAKGRFSLRNQHLHRPNFLYSTTG